VSGSSELSSPLHSDSSLGQWLALNNHSDEQLASSLLSGQRDALAVLFDRYHRLVYSVAMRIVHDPGEAEDVVQTVFLDFYRAVANFDPQKGMLKVWLLQYAYHRALHRKRHLMANRFYVWVDLESSAGEPSLSWSPGESFEAARLMEQTLAGLRPRRRTVLELTYLEGLTADEIAIRLEISVNVVRHELYRGLSELRKNVSKQPHKIESASGKEPHGARASAF
jgi:RNA polymerase sigma-70 factor (ECF subfamily)